jgi:hypothetical protein
MKWILASERLPDKGGMYFVKCYHEEYLDNIVKASVQINSSGEYFFNNPFFKILEWLDESPLVDHPKQREVYIPCDEEAGFEVITHTKGQITGKFVCHVKKATTPIVEGYSEIDIEKAFDAGADWKGYYDNRYDGAKWHPDKTKYLSSITK